MKIFVTGGTGFIGYHLINELLKKGHTVTTIIRQEKDRKRFKNKNIKVFIGNLDNEELLKKGLKDIDVLYHLAAIRRDWGISKEEYNQTNVLLTKKILESAAGKIKHFVFVSSVKAIDPENEYAMSKLQAEIVTRQLCKQNLIPFTIVRTAIVYGPGDHSDGMIPKLIDLIKNKKFVLIGNGNNRIHLIYINDLITAMVKIGNRKGRGEVFIIASSNSITLANLSKIIAKEYGINIFPVKIPLWFAYPMVIIFEKINKLLQINNEPVVTINKLKTITQDHNYNIKLAKKLIGFKSQVNYQQGIVNTINELNSRNG